MGRKIKPPGVRFRIVPSIFVRIVASEIHTFPFRYLTMVALYRSHREEIKFSEIVIFLHIRLFLNKFINYVKPRLTL